MTFREIAATFAERPYQPHRIVMADGRTYDVPHPELVLLGITVTTVGVAPTVIDGYVAAEHTVKLANEHITSLVPIAVPDRAK